MWHELNLASLHCCVANAVKYILTLAQVGEFLLSQMWTFTSAKTKAMRDSNKYFFPCRTWMMEISPTQLQITLRVTPVLWKWVKRRHRITIFEEISKHFPYSNAGKLGLAYAILFFLKSTVVVISVHERFDFQADSQCWWTWWFH